MAINSDTVNDALAGNVDCGETQAKFIAEELLRVLAERGLSGRNALTAEATVKRELDQWASDLAEAGEQLGGENLREFLEKVGRSIDAELKMDAHKQSQQESEGTGQMKANDEAHGARATQMDLLARQEGLPHFQHGSAEAPGLPLDAAPMNGLVVARLAENECIMTSELSSCTGVGIYDPGSGVGAVLHLEKNIAESDETKIIRDDEVIVKKYDAVTIQNALEEMQKLAPDLNPANLQVMLLPGDTESVGGSHLEALKAQLEEAGVLAENVRDLSLEGRRGSTLFLGPGGNVTAFSAAQQQELNQEEELQGEAPANNVADAANLQRIEQPEIQGEGTNVRAKLGRSNSSPNLQAYTKKL